MGQDSLLLLLDFYFCARFDFSIDCVCDGVIDGNSFENNPGGVPEPEEKS